ncbi:MAG TPA: TetR/AcrR family transcriptional regulator [Solirubrobacterales bacterium]|jgi:AcrR family transcriptional regulator|nr:TetR/AcrR family transcriptional regulator [Solirubrobacterales bacterium]
MSEPSAAPDRSEEIAPVVPFPGLRARAPRERLLEGVLLVSGELGYERVAVKDVIQRARASRATFYKYFEGREDCFAQAYGDASQWLYRRMIGAANRQSSWREGLRAAMAEMLEFCANQPAIAKALFVEVHAAGERALAQRADLMERLSHALDSARREIPSRQAPPPVTSTFMVGAIDTLVCAKLMDDEAAKAPEMLPGLLYFVVMQYFGEQAAWEEMTAAPVATWNARRGASSQLP